MRKGKNLNCKICNKEFYAKPSFVKRGARFCSIACSDKAKFKNVPLICKLCGKEYYRAVSQVKWRGTGFCSNKCKWKSYTTRTSESIWNYKGDKVGYRDLHKWVERHLGKPNKCEFCKFETNKPYSFHWANKSWKYKRKLDDWIRLCLKCHRAYDRSKNVLA